MKRIYLLISFVVVFLVLSSSVYADHSIIVYYNSDMGTVSGDRGPFADDDVGPHELTAMPNPNYTFTGWTLDGSIPTWADPAVSLDTDRDRCVTANFAPLTYNVSVSSSEGGSACISSPEHSSPFSFDETITVVADPAEGYQFQSWTEGGTIVSTDSSYSFQAANRNLVANFSRVQCTVNASANPSAGGSVDPTFFTYDKDTNHTFTATQNANYTFVGWYDESGTWLSSNATEEFTAFSDRSIVARFEENQPQKTQYQYTITASAEPVIGGVVVPQSGVFDAGTDNLFIAYESTDYRFVGWYENNVRISTNPSELFTAYANRTIVARFEKIVTPQFTITYYPGAGVAGNSVTDTWDAGTAYLRDQYYLRSGYTQTGWSTSQNGAKTYELNAVINRDRNLVLYPYWTKNAGTLQLTVNYYGPGVVYWSNGAKVTNGSTVNISEGSSYTFRMIPDSECYYVYSINLGGRYWNANVGTDQFMVTYDMMRAANRTLTIRFASVYDPPKTGDDSNILLWASLFAMSAAGVTGGLILKKKSRI